MDVKKARSISGIKGKSDQTSVKRKLGELAKKYHPDHRNEIIEEFLDKKNTFAVIGVSENPEKYGNKIFYDLKSAGYHVYPINPRIDRLNGEKCYASLKDLPSIPDVIDIVVPPKIAEEIIKEAVKLGIKKVWMQPGSQSDKAIEYCKKYNVLVLHDMCIMIEKSKLNE